MDKKRHSVESIVALMIAKGKAIDEVVTNVGNESITWPIADVNKELGALLSNV